MSWRLSMWIVVFCLWPVLSHAALLDPRAFTLLDTLNTRGTININTDTLQLNGGAAYTGVLNLVSGASIFTFDDITATNLSIFGTRTLGLLSRGNMAFTGTNDLLGSGGLDMVASGSMTLTNVSAMGGRQTVSLTANQINLGGTVDSGSRFLGISTVEPINLSGGFGSGIIRLSGRDGLVFPTGVGITRGTVELGSGQITLAGGTTSGQIAVFSTSQIAGISGVSVVEPVPMPASLLLFATGLAGLPVMTRRSA